MAQVKGTLLVGIVDVIKAAGERGLSLVPEPLRHYVESELIVTTQWYPFEDYFGLLKARLPLTQPPPGVNIYAHVGAERAREAFRGKYKDLIVVGNMAESLESTARIWKFLIDAADARTEVTEPGKANFEVVGFSGGNREFCMTLTGFIGACPELVGFKDGTAMKTRCIHDGDDRCRWEMSWTEND